MSDPTQHVTSPPCVHVHRGTLHVTMEEWPPDLRIHAGQVWTIEDTWRTFRVLSADFEKKDVELRPCSVWQSLKDRTYQLFLWMLPSTSRALR